LTSEESTNTQSEETTSSQINQEFVQFLQQEKYNEHRFKSIEHWFRYKCNSICKSAHEQIIANAYIYNENMIIL
jgi:hypothetical protein